VIYVKVKGIQTTIFAACLCKAEFFYAHHRDEILPNIQKKAA